MKIIHCSDIHFGLTHSRLSAEKKRIRVRELRESFCDMLQFAAAEGVRAIVIAGDLFDKDFIVWEDRNEVFAEMKKHPTIDFLYLRGNHDNLTDLTAGDLELPSNLRMFDDGQAWSYFAYDSVCIAGINIERQSGTDFYEWLRLEKNNFNIVVMHGTKEEILTERLRGRFIDYLALGDAHAPDLEPKKLDARGAMAYSGCLVGHGYDEVGEHGFFMLDICEKKYSRTFHSVAKRRVERREVDVTGLGSLSEIEQAVLQRVADIDKEHLVRVELVGRHLPQLKMDCGGLEDALKKQFFAASVKDCTRLDLGIDVFGSGVSLGSEFVKLVGESDLDDEQKEQVMTYGILALRGEDIDL